MPSKFDYLYNSTNRRVRQDLAGTLYIMRALKFKFTRFFGIFAYSRRSRTPNFFLYHRVIASIL